MALTRILVATDLSAHSGIAVQQAVAAAARAGAALEWLGGKDRIAASTSMHGTVLGSVAENVVRASQTSLARAMRHGAGGRPGHPRRSVAADGRAGRARAPRLEAGTMKILFVTNNLPFPPTDGWKIRVWGLIRHLRARHRVTVASFMRTTEDPAAVSELRAHCEAVHVIPRAPRYSPWKLLQGAVGPLPFSIVNYQDVRMRALLHNLCATQSFDLIQAESLHMAQYCLGTAVPTVLDLHNIESMLMRRYAAQTRHPLQRAYAELTWRKLLEYERWIYGAFDQCLVCSEEDRRLALMEAPSATITVVPNGVEAGEYRPDDGSARAARPAQLVFIGRMDYHANVDGAEWLCRELLPRVTARRPDVKLAIVGAHPTRQVYRLARPGAVDVTGFVEDVRPYLTDAVVVLIPLRVGGGTRLKLLEAMAAGKAIVSTTVGAEGIDVTHEQDILLADRPDDFARHILNLLADGQARARIGRAARRLAETRYDWSGIVQALERIYERRASAGTGRAPQAGPVRNTTLAVVER